MENQRIRISKKMLKDALMRLLAVKRIEKITIYELCSEAGINRTTFYKYYGSQYELLDEIEREFLAELEHFIMQADKDRMNTLQRVMEYIKSERGKCSVLLNAVPDSDFAEKLFALPAIGEALDNSVGINLSEVQRKYVRIFFCNGGYAIIRKWQEDGCREPIEEIAGLLDTLSESLSGEKHEQGL